ncbi:MAG: Lrp/AsnC family transcriptional regulator [Synergistaceae bacterium]|jgi:Lrp/AsnC family leucine-responsive transcriptional regulator|nr:Lrp/AsnC family transcriptional regulator [Synergistaceae bacterium]
MEKKLPDATDWRILDELQRNARVPFGEMSAKLGVGEAELEARVKRMEADGIITGYRADVDPRKAGYGISAIISVSTEGKTRDQIINDALAENPEVTACWSVTGASDFLIEAHAPSLEFLEELLNELAKYGRLTTSIVLPRYGKRRIILPPRESMTD